MTNRGSLARTALSVLTIALTAMGSLIGALSFLAPPAAAATCDQAGSAIVGTWVITTAQVCSGILYTVDGTITINAGGSLTMLNGGLKFTEDTTHIYSMTVNAGGSLTLDNSIITTEPRSLAAYLKLAFTVNGGTLRMQNGAILKFPGTFSATAGSTISISRSTITGHLTADVTPWVGAAAADDNDDAPTMTWSSTTVDIYDSRIERLYEDASRTSPSPRAILAIGGTTVLTAFNSYIGVDFNPDVNKRHNEIQADGTSQANLLGVTIDQVQSDAASRDTWIPAFVPIVGSTSQFHFYRWLDAFVTDNVGFPASGAGVWSQWGAFQQTVYYPDNGNALCPGAKILAYLGPSKTCANFNVTGPDGHALLPLFTDQIDTTTTPNAASFGNFEETARLAPNSASMTVAFDPYPIITAVSNSKTLTLPISSLVLPGTIQWSGTMAITGTVISLAGSLEITGTVTVTDGGIYLSVQSDACGRAVIKITGTGRLNLVNSTVSSNCPLTLYAGNSGRLSASRGSSLKLDSAAGSGTLRSDGSAVLSVVDSTIDGNVLAAGASVSFRRDTFTGMSISINTAQRSELWDANLGATQTLQFLSDDGSVSTPDFDIRNTTFNGALTAQLRFGGTQWAQLTNVVVTQPAGMDWWAGMITQNAKVTRYWWLRVDAVDGTGTLLQGANALITVSRLNSATLTWAAVPNPGVDDIYMAGTSVWPVTAPRGFILYRAATEDRYAPANLQWMNATYRGESSATVSSVTYFPDANLTAFVQTSSTITLIFSALTPEMSISAILTYYQANQTSLLPIGRTLNITAVTRNTGSISVRNAVVSFFSTNVDANSDGLMDASKAAYISAGLWIGDYTIPLLPLRSSAVAYVPWTYNGVAETTIALSAVVDAPLNDPRDPGMFRELNERNNIYGITVLLHVWPDLHVGTTDISPGTPIEGNAGPVLITVHNDGTNDATGASAVLSDDSGWRSPPVQFNLGRGLSTTVTISWTPTTSGVHTISVGVYTRPLPEPDRNIDFNWANNWASRSVNVRTKPDIWLNQTDFAGTIPATRGVPFAMPVIVRNRGDTAAVGFTVSVFLDQNINVSALVGRLDDVGVGANSQTTINIIVTANAIGSHTMTIFADSHNTDGTLTRRYGSIVEGSESNNFANQTVQFSAPRATLLMTLITSPPNGFAPGTTLNVEGFINNNATGEGIPGIPIAVDLFDPSGNRIANATTTSGNGGLWRVALTIPSGAPNGAHRIQASTVGGGVGSVSQNIEVRRPGEFFNLIFFGLPVWLWLVIVVIVVVLAVGLTLYFKVYGLGKMVECGECGSFIPEDSTSCPKCGVEFEKDMAKCSNCQAWIPVDVKQCPECGVEFATGKVEMADYQEKMRMQYDEVVAKFRDESQRSLGRALTEREFQDWWRKQPTFVTFEDWLREEEEMRKMGSKPCPACGTLNSVTATVCHKCGTYLKEERRPPTGGAPARTEPSGAESAGAAPSEAVPKKVIRKPVAAPPMVQKKVVKKPLGEQQEGGSDTQNPPNEEF